nr:ATP synthase F0 subunit 6 [Trachelipus rathkii]
MTNLFSVFDPSSGVGMSFNWVSFGVGFFMFPMNKWGLTSRSGSWLTFILGKLYSEVKPIFSIKGSVTSLMFMAMFLFIIMNNMMGLIPYIFTATSHLAVTLSLALPMWLGYFSYGWVSNMKWMLAHLMPQGTPIVLMPFMVIIESVSSLIRPATLAVRLMANMIAGHLLLTLVSNAVYIFNFNSVLSVVTLQILLVVLEVAVAAIQAYVFVVLSVLYSSEI